MRTGGHLGHRRGSGLSRSMARSTRGYNGQNSRWYQAAMRQKAGRIIAAGMRKRVTFKPVDGSINDHVDDVEATVDLGEQYVQRVQDVQDKGKVRCGGRRAEVQNLRHLRPGQWFRPWRLPRVPDGTLGGASDDGGRGFGGNGGRSLMHQATIPAAKASAAKSDDRLADAGLAAAQPTRGACRRQPRRCAPRQTTACRIDRRQGRSAFCATLA